MSRKELQEIVKEFLPKIKGLTEHDISQITRMILYSTRNSPIDVEFFPFSDDDKGQTNPWT